MRRLSSLMIVLPLAALLALAGANMVRNYRLEHAYFDASLVGGTYGFHEGAPLRSLALTKKPWTAPSAARLAAARGSAMLLGVETKTGPFSLWRVAQFQNAVERNVDLVQYSRPWSQPFQSFLAEDVWRRGALPILTWEPWSYKHGLGPGGARIHQPEYSLRTMINGGHDDYIRAYARALRAFNHPILLRFAPEMNGDWNSWSEGLNGNKRGDYVRAWRHIHRLFAQEGATNVIWIWAPNVVYHGSKALTRFYPGDRYVDVVGLDGYNWGDMNSWSRWQGFDSVFGPSLTSLQRLAPAKPILITETASTEAGGSKAQWIKDLFDGLRRHPEIIGVNWFNQVKETDWRVQSSKAAQQMFANENRFFPESAAARSFRERLWALDQRLNPAQATLKARGQAVIDASRSTP